MPSQLTVPNAVWLWDSQSPGTGSFSYPTSQRTEIIEIFWEDEQAAIIQVLGRHVVGANNKLVRTNPIQHPTFPQLYATKIITQQELGTPGEPAALRQPVGAAIKNVCKGSNKFGPFSKYARSRLTVLFETLPYDTDWDTDLKRGFEFWRYTTRRFVTTADAAVAEKGTFKYVEGAAGNPSGKQVPFGVQKIIRRGDYTVKWWNVPDAYILDDNAVPANLHAGVGYVNDNSADPFSNGAGWMGFPRGTLLMMPYELSEPHYVGFPQNAGDVETARYFDVTLHFKYFNPDLGAGAASRGHNTAIWPGDFKNYLVKDAKTGTTTVYPYLDFNTLFQAV